MAVAELNKRGIPVKKVTHGTIISWDEIQGGGPSPHIFMPPFPRDIYVPEFQLQKGRDILSQFGWTQDELTLPKIRTWQRVAAAIALLLMILGFISLFVFIDK